MSLKLTGAWPTLSLWLEQAPWGISVYDKWVVLQINCSYCSRSATLTEGEQRWPCWCCATVTHGDELTVYSEVHITIMSSYRAFVTYDSINAVTVNQQAAKLNLFPGATLNTDQSCSHPAKRFQSLKTDKMIKWFREEHKSMYYLSDCRQV